VTVWWAISQWATIAKPLLSCEAVISEACFLLRNVFRGGEGVMILVETQIIQLPFRLNEEITAIKTLLNRYQSVPMSLADACLVRMSEQFSESTVLTLDNDFTIYRKNTNQTIPVITPESMP
jgi:hypothetical protein